ncbi:MAG: hypothetical protein LBK69_04385 [Syntrophomonadaceae bacterium]|jgi:group I intron endonuclease|nr:hypothetical protein [Syntrophomonadaceae bacterium]
MENYGYIYITTNKINGKRYIGQHKSKDWDSDYVGSGKLLHYAIKKYGIEKFICLPLAWAWNKAELNQLEIEYIAHYRPEYNISTGGTGGNLGEKVSEILSEKCKGEKNGMYGKKHTNETKLKMIEARNNISEETRKKIGEGNKGKKHSEETKKKLSEINKGKSLSEETRRKMSESASRKIHSEETKQKISKNSKGRLHFTNGKTNIFQRECPEGFWPGQISSKKVV